MVGSVSLEKTSGAQPGLLLLPRGHLAMSGGTCGCYNWGVGAADSGRRGVLLSVLQFIPVAKELPSPESQWC